MSKPGKKRGPYRADRRNAVFGRKPRGNTKPMERRAIWALQPFRSTTGRG